MKKKYQVFLSSTYQDLIEERALAIQTLLEMDFIPCGMELFPASDDDQWTLIKKLIDECDYYMVIVGGLYGSLNSEGKSYTQLEYEYAVQKGKPVIAFLHDKIDLLPSNKCESSEVGRRNLNAFKDLCKRKLVKFWNNPQQLAGLINTGISKLVDSKPGVGWIRCDHINELQQANGINPQDFFYTLDDKASANFPEIIKGAKKFRYLQERRLIF